MTVESMSLWGRGDCLFGNLNALAMEPLGHMAGLGAALIGAISTFISLPFGWLIGQLYDGTVLPLVGGFCGPDHRALDRAGPVQTVILGPASFEARPEDPLIDWARANGRVAWRWQGLV